MNELLDWVEKAALENLRFRLQNAETLAREANILLAVLLGGMGAALAYTVKALESGALTSLSGGVAVLAGWLMLSAMLLVLKCVMSRDLQVPGNHVGNLWQPGREFESLRKGELNGVQERIDLTIVRNRRMKTPTAPLAFKSGYFLSPLRYPGGKGRLGPWLGQIVDANGLRGGCYIEPYAGGAGAALYLLVQGFVEQIVINDVDPSIHAFWQAITAHTDEFVERVRDTPVTLDKRLELQNVIANPGHYSVVDLGFATFFLNRTSRSGILAGGVIGGKAQNGRYKLDARFNKQDLIARIQLIGSMRERIAVFGLDALDLLTTLIPNFPEQTLVYLDPPYFLKGSQLYRNYYVSDDHAAISKLVGRATYPILVTYDDCDEIRSLYQGVQSSTFSLQYSTHLTRPKTSEVLFYSNLQIPHPPLMTRSSRPRTKHETTTSDLRSSQL